LRYSSRQRPVGGALERTPVQLGGVLAVLAALTVGCNTSPNPPCPEIDVLWSGPFGIWPELETRGSGEEAVLSGHRDMSDAHSGGVPPFFAMILSPDGDRTVVDELPSLDPSPSHPAPATFRDRSGRVHIAWLSEGRGRMVGESGDRGLWGATFSSGRWNPVRLSDAGAVSLWTGASRPRFSERHDGSGVIPVARSGPSGSHPRLEWVTVQNGLWNLVSPTPDAFARAGDAATLPDGAMAVVAVGRGLVSTSTPSGFVDSQTPRVFVARVNPSLDSWEAWLPLQELPGRVNASSPRVFTGADGMLHATWTRGHERTSVLNEELWHARIDPQTLQVLAMGRVDSSFHIGNLRPESIEGRPVLVYLRSIGPTPRGEVVVRFWEGGGWSEAMELGFGEVVYFDFTSAGGFGATVLMSRRPRVRWGWGSTAGEMVLLHVPASCFESGPG
jgi:hypothetical protein